MKIWCQTRGAVHSQVSKWKWFKKAIFPCLYLVNLSTQGNDCSLMTFVRCGAAERAGLALEKEPFNSILPLFYSSLSLSVWVCFELVVYEVFIAIFFSIATLINSILSLLYSSLSLSVKVCCELVVYEVIIAVFFPITTSFPHCLAFGSHREYTKCHRSLRTPWSTLLEFSNSDVNGNSSAEKHSNVRLCHLLSKVHEVPLT